MRRQREEEAKEKGLRSNRQKIKLLRETLVDIYGLEQAHKPPQGACPTHPHPPGQGQEAPLQRRHLRWGLASGLQPKDCAWVGCRAVSHSTGRCGPVRSNQRGLQSVGFLLASAPVK